MHLKLISHVKLMQDIALLVPQWRVNKSILLIYLQPNLYERELFLCCSMLKFYISLGADRGLYGTNLSLSFAKLLWRHPAFKPKEVLFHTANSYTVQHGKCPSLFLFP